MSTKKSAVKSDVPNTANNTELKIDTLMMKLIRVNIRLSEINFEPTGYNTYQKFAYLTIADTMNTVLEECKKENIWFIFTNFKPEVFSIKEDGEEKSKGVFTKFGDAAMATGELTMVVIDTETGESVGETTYCSVLNKGDKAPQVLLTNLKKMLMAQVFYGVSKGIKEEAEFAGEINKWFTPKASAPAPTQNKSISFDKPNSSNIEQAKADMFGKPEVANDIF